MRGTQIPYGKVRHPVRSIPAYAGNTPWTLLSRAISGDYSRSHGGNVPMLGICSKRYGLPPPTRGIQHTQPHQHQPHRPTPAHAGNPCDIAQHGAIAWVYPHPRGEPERYDCDDFAMWGLPPATRGTPPRSNLITPIRGLPPPTRGIPVRSDERLATPRSTPAHAGDPLSLRLTVCAT